MAILWRRTASRSDCVCRVIWMVRGERVIGAGVALSQGGSWMGALLGDSFEALYEATEDIDACSWVQGGVEHIASCHCSQ